MGDPETAEEPSAPRSALSAIIPGKEFLTSRKGQLLLAEWVVSFLTFICYVASTAVGLMTVPLLEFLWALFTFFAYSTKLNEQLKGILWPLLDFIRCVSAAIIYFVVSLVAVSKYSCGASKAAAVLGFIATIVFAIDFYIIFNDLIKFLKKGESSEDGPPQQKSDDDDFDSDSD
ncbi:PREDICTED: CKLF-like MARVEL transmembrane domain-containing protein 3 [Nanorana parkeri]|uniref:CKLF-like MARVEL transmembrane domain-containing protein 3 n=1 Tax=Nanorana parkeri TaxID=125878 RepID=UPI000854B03C|nr:PREDICTED: CKLF-like MARVEL transmembrane domain-containing protein 3 [Nanorana parkeri]